MRYSPELVDVQRTLAARINAPSLTRHVAALSSSPRVTGTPDIARAERYVAEQLEGLGWDVHVEDGRPFGNTPARPGELQLHNLVAERRGTAPDAERGLVVAGAHIDTVDHAPGANDNASGAATLIEIAAALRDMPTRNDVRLVWFDGEERGLLGSMMHVRGDRANLAARGVAMINADMVASPKGTLGYSLGKTGGLSSGLVDVLDGAAAAVGVPMQQRNEHHSRSDHESFDAIGMPSVNFGPSVARVSSEDPSYHSSHDTAYNTSAAVHEQFSDVVVAALYAFAQQPLVARG